MTVWILNDLAWLAILALAFAIFLWISTKPFEEINRLQEQKRQEQREAIEKALGDYQAHRERNP